METEYFDCQCLSAEHTLRFVLDPTDGNLWTEVYIGNSERFFTRLWRAIQNADILIVH